MNEKPTRLRGLLFGSSGISGERGHSLQGPAVCAADTAETTWADGQLHGHGDGLYGLAPSADRDACRHEPRNDLNDRRSGRLSWRLERQFHQESGLVARGVLVPHGPSPSSPSRCPCRRPRPAAVARFYSPGNLRRTQENPGSLGNLTDSRSSLRSSISPVQLPVGCSRQLPVSHR